LRATDVTQRLPVLDRAVGFGVARAGALATVRAGGVTVARAVERGIARGVVRGTVRSDVRAVTRGGVFAGVRSIGRRSSVRSGARAGTTLRDATTGGGGGSAEERSTAGAESVGATVPADCNDTGSAATTGVDWGCVESTAAMAIAVSRTESAVAAIAVESEVAAVESGCESTTFRPNDSAFG
jgi:hypothetical protein